MLDGLNFSLHDRYTILRVESFVYYQFSASKFTNFIRYPWYESNFIPPLVSQFRLITYTEYLEKLYLKSTLNITVKLWIKCK